MPMILLHALVVFLHVLVYEMIFSGTFDRLLRNADPGFRAES